MYFVSHFIIPHYMPNENFPLGILRISRVFSKFLGTFFPLKGGGNTGSVNLRKNGGSPKKNFFDFVYF